MTSTIGNRFVKLLLRRQGDPIANALSGSPSTDPSVVAFVEQLQMAAGAEEAVTASIPIDAISVAAAAGPDPERGDLTPVRRHTRRRLFRFAATAGLTAKTLLGAAAIAAVSTTAAVTGTLPDTVQDFVSDTVDNVGIEIPRGHGESGELPVPASDKPTERIEYRNAVADHNTCVQDARRGYIAATGSAAGFSASEACGERPDPKDYDTPSGRAPGSNTPNDDSPSLTGPPATAPGQDNSQNPGDGRGNSGR